MKTYILDERKSSITWKGESDENRSLGNLKFAGGKLITELDKLVEGFIAIDFDSLSVSDTSLNSDEKNELMRELKSENYLDTSHFPNGEYKITDVVNEAGKTKLRGILSLKNEAFGMSVPVNLKVSEKQITAAGDFKLQHINHPATEKINKKVSGEEIDDIELSFKLVADAEAL